MNASKIGGRKFAMTFAVVLLGAAVDIWGKGLSQNLGMLMGAALATYAGANVWAKFGAAKVDTTDIKNTVILEELTAQLNKIKSEDLHWLRGMVKDLDTKVKNIEEHATPLPGLTEDQEELIKKLAVGVANTQNSQQIINNRLVAITQALGVQNV